MCTVSTFVEFQHELCTCTSHNVHVCTLFISKPTFSKEKSDDEDSIVQWSDDSSFVSTPPSRLPGSSQGMYVYVWGHV